MLGRKSLAKFGILVFLFFLSVASLYLFSSKEQVEAQPDSSVISPISITEIKNEWGKIIISTEPPFIMDIKSLDSLERQGNCVEMKEFDGYFSAISQNETSWSNKFLGFTANVTLDAGWLQYGTTNLTGSNFTYLSNKTVGSRYFEHIYYKNFPTVPNGTEEDFRFRVCFDSKPDFAVFYFGSGSSAVLVDDTTAHFIVTTGNINTSIQQNEGFIDGFVYKSQNANNPISDAANAIDWVRNATSFTTLFGTGDTDDSCSLVENTSIRSRILCRPGEMELQNKNWTTEFISYGESVNYTDVIVNKGTDDQDYQIYISFVGMDGVESSSFASNDSAWIRNSSETNPGNHMVCEPLEGSDYCSAISTSDWVSATDRMKAGFVAFTSNYTTYAHYVMWNDTLTGDQAISQSNTGYLSTVIGYSNPAKINATQVKVRLGFHWNTTVKPWNEVKDTVYPAFLNRSVLVVNDTSTCDSSIGNIINCTTNSVGDISITVDPQENVTEVFYQVGNWTLSEVSNIYIYNNTQETPDTATDLWIRLNYANGVWNYHSDTVYLGTKCNDKKLDESVCNITGVVSDGNTFYLVFMYTHSSPQYIKVQSSGKNPQWFGNLTNASLPQAYSPTRAYEFNVTWNQSTDSNGYNVSFIEHNFTGDSTPANFTTTRDNNVTTYNIVGIPSNTSSYFYRFFANNSADDWNTTDWFPYTITQATPSVDVNPITSVTYPSSTQTGCERVTGDTGATLTVYRNGTSVSSGTSPQNETAIVLGGAVYNYTCTISSTQNYTTAELANQHKTISTNTSTSEFINLTINDTESNKIFSFFTLSNATGYNDTTVFNGQSVTFSLLRNTTNISVSTAEEIIELGAGFHTYNYSTNGNPNYTAGNKTFNLTINKRNVSLVVSPSTASVTYPSLQTQSCNDNSTRFSCSLFRNGTNITSTNNTQVTYGVGGYNFTTNVTANLTNYTWTEAQTILTVSQNTSAQNFMNLTINGTEANTTYTYPIASNATGYNDTTVWNGQAITFTLERNGTSLGDATLEDRELFGVAVYNYTYSTTGNANYSGSLKFFFLTIEQNTSTSNFINLTLNSTETNRTYIYLTASNATAWYRDANIFANDDITFTLYRNDTSIQSTNPSSENNTLGVGIHNYSYSTLGNVNFTLASKFLFLNISLGTSNTTAFELNDTFIDINQTVLLTVNISSVANATAEIQTSDDLINLSLFRNSVGNYTLELNKTFLGELVNNASTYINVSNIFVGGNNFSVSSNSTNLNLSYASANVTTFGDTPDPLSISPSAILQLFAKYVSTESTDLTGSTCEATLLSSTFTMSYDAISSRYEVFIDVSSETAGTAAYTIDCTNTSYQSSLSNAGTFTLTVGGGAAGPSGGGGGGGGGGGSCVTSGACVRDVDCCAGFYCTGLVGDVVVGECESVAEVGLPTNFSFDVSPKLIQPLPVTLPEDPSVGLFALQDIIKIFNRETGDVLVPEWSFTNETNLGSYCTLTSTDDENRIEPATFKDYELNCPIPSDTPVGTYRTSLLVWPRGFSRSIAKAVRIAVQIGGTPDLLTQLFQSRPDPAKFIDSLVEWANFPILCITTVCSADSPIFVDLSPSPVSLGPFVIIGFTIGHAVFIIAVVVLVWFAKWRKWI